MNWQAFRLYALWCWHQLLTLGLAALVVVAVMVGVSRELLPLADDYRPRLEQALGQRLGMPVTLQRLEGEADGLQLFLRLVRVDLRDPAQPEQVLLSVPEAEIRPKIWSSLWHRELRVDVRLRGLDLHVDQQPDGRFQLRELASLARRDARSAERTLGFVLRQPVLALSESRIAITLQKLPPVTLAGLELVNRNEGDSHRLAGRLRLPGAAEELALQAELDGDPLHWRAGRVRAWLRLPVLTLDGWLPAVAAAGSRYGVTIDHLRGGGRYWLELDRGRLVSARADIDWRDVHVSREGQPRRLQRLRGQLAWSRNTGGWQVAGSGLEGWVDDQRWPLPSLALRGGPGTLTAAARNINVAGALRLLAWVKLPPTLADWLREAAPEGQVGSLRADLAAAAAGWSLRRLDVEVSGIGLRTVGTRPGLQGLGGWVRWTPDAAWAGLALRRGSLHLPNFQPDPIPVFGLEGRLRLRREGAAWRLDSGRLGGANGDLGASGVLSVLLPPAPAQPRVSLAAEVSQARAGSAWRYVPQHAAGDKTVAWLRDHLTAGTIPRAELYYEGPLHGDPVADPGHFLLRADLRRATLAYASGWPVLRDLDAEVVLDGSRLLVRRGSARLLDGSRGHDLAAEIPDLHAGVLSVAGSVDSSGADLSRLFRDSPLAQQLPGLTDVLALEGPLSGRLALTLPLKEHGPPEVAVSARLADNRLFIKPARLTVSRLHGDLAWSTTQGLSSPALTGELLEAPVRAAVASEGPRRGTVVVTAAGSAGVPALRRWLGSSLLDYTSGSAPWQARLTVPAGGTPRLQVDSPLTGVRVALPAPLGKAATEALPLRYQASLGGNEQFARLQYGQRLAAGLVWQGSRLDRALFRLDSTTAAWPQQPGLEIEGRVTRLDVGEWRPVVQRQARRERPATVAVRGDEGMPDVTRLDLDVQDLLVEGWRLRDARIDLRRQGAAWQLGVDSDELAASARLPDAPGSEIVVGFSRLQWPLPQAPGKVAAGGAGLNPVAGLGNRPVAVSGEGLRLAAWPGLGALAVKARLLPLPAGLRVEGIDLRGPHLGFDGQLDWLWRGGDSSRLQGSASTANLAGLLTALGMPQPISGRGARAELDLSWPGAPDRAAPALLDGRLKLVLEPGRLLNVSTGTSASRVFGWFSLENLQRRLKGDFGDVTRRGLSFDSVSVEGTLNAGVMQPALVRVKGPTLQAEGQGRIDLGQRRIDQHYSVVVPMTSAVPIAAVVMAGPVVGGAVAAAQMAFDKQIDKATQLHYHVSGSWSDPHFERLAGRPVQAGRSP